MRRRSLLAVVVLVCASYALDASRQPAVQPDFAPVRQHIERAMAERNLMSVAVAVSRGPDVLWSQGFGWADREAGRQATAETPYSLASISKPVTATALMALAEQGRIDLDAPLDRYLGGPTLTGHAGPSDQATVRRVLAHTAGLPLHYQFFYADGSERAPSMADTIARYGIVVTPPGGHYEYSNVGFGILGHAVEVTAGQPLAEALRALVFAPLGMTQSALNPRSDFAPAAALRYGSNQRPIPSYTTDHPAASEVYASARDLVRFGMFHLGVDPAGGVPPLGRDARAHMQAAATPAGVDPAYGMGWFIMEEFGFRKVYHTGSMPGVSTMLALYPEHDVAVAVLLNSLDREQRVEIAREIAAVVIPRYAAARRAPQRERGSTPVPDELTDQLWSGTLRTWSGPLAFELRVSRGRLLARIGRNEELFVRNARMVDGRLTGRVAASIEAPDLARAGRYELSLNLHGNGDRLSGAVTATSMGEPTLFNLTSYAELRAAGGQ